MKDALKYRHASIGQARTFRKNMTDTEQKLWSHLRRNQLGHYFRRQVPIGNTSLTLCAGRKNLLLKSTEFNIQQ